MPDQQDAGREPDSEMPRDPTEDVVPEWWPPISAWLVAAHPYHRALFIGFNVLLTAINLYTGKPWWALWPLLITGVVYTVHFLIYSAVTLDDDWVDERAADLYDKSYDQGHINSIADRYELETASARRDEAERRAYHEAVLRAKKESWRGAASEKTASGHEANAPRPVSGGRESAE